ncbi:alpha/beta fold hydrolase [Lacibacter sp. H375]|uniref:alpha/beta fold hydrolase n=1 Tax=Lacibacter sp. H375 TaxID=3133424 RepID=UPI0030C490DC
MKTLLLLFFILATIASSFSQQKDFKCACSQIGIDSLWADSNKIACYSIPVVRDVSNKAAGKFYLSVVVAPSINKTNDDPLLYLHGGPGIATLENVPRYLKSKTWKLIRENKSLVFFDYRGTGFSEPALCPGLQDSLAEFSKNNNSLQARQSYKTALYKRCRSQLLSTGIDVSVFNSFQLSEDAEAIRQTLQIKKWNVYGVSYGTTVALNLLRNHGKPISAMILDSPYPPNAPWLDFVRPFDTCFKVLEAKIASDPVAFSHFPSIRTDFVNAVTRLNKNPVKIKNKNSEYDFTGDDFAWSVWTALLKPDAIPLVPLAISEVGKGSDSILSKWVVAFNDPNAHGTFSEVQSKAILCYEGKPRTQADTKASLLAKYPDFSSFNIDFEGDVCEAWQPNSAGEKVFEPVVSNVPVLILSGEYDPVCPPFFGEITARTLSKSTFINVPSASHAAIHADECVQNIAVAFLNNPQKKPAVDCVNNRPQIKFVTDSLMTRLVNFNKK